MLPVSLSSGQGLRPAMSLLCLVLALSVAGADAQADLVRGPYLQLGTDEAMTVRWRTDMPADSRVAWGLSPESLNEALDDATVTTEHELRITGLEPSTVYYYAVGSTTETLAGGDEGHYFRTAPVPGSETPFRAWILGDSGAGGAAAVRDAYDAFTGARHTDLWLMLGDNAYPNGSDLAYQIAVFDMFPEMLRTSALWSTRGNHEDFEADYYGMFTFPTAGEAGGVPSGSEAYYSFDFANVHFVCLDTEATSLDPGSPMLTWLVGDLAASTSPWTIAFFHHPPYSRGTHNSDNPIDSGGRMVAVRENVLPILEAHGVDLVFSGHSHSYERSFLLDGHYGTSDTLDPSMILDGGDGREDGTGAYSKTAGPHRGAVYCVAGSSGGAGGGPLDHPAMFTSLNVMGSVVLDVAVDRIDVTFVDSTGGVSDYYTLFTDPGVVETVGADLDCIPSTGTLPFSTTMSVTLSNAYEGTARTVAASLDAGLASGQQITSWRAGFTNVPAAGEFSTSWVQALPALATLVGESSFSLRAEDVTAAPFNQPPYPPAGDTDTASCTVTGVHP